MHYICYSCQIEFESKKLLIGRTEVVGACPCKRDGAEGPLPLADSWQYSEARTREVARARRHKGELVAWIQQGTNPGYVQNLRRVDQGDEKAITGVAGGVCRTIVAAFSWMTLTTRLVDALNEFSTDMRCIPEKYLRAQQTFKNASLEYNVHHRLYKELLREVKAMKDNRPPDLEDRLPGVLARNQTHLTGMQRALDEYNQTGFGISLKDETTERELEAANAASVLDFVLRSPGSYHVNLSQTVSDGHAVGFWIGSVAKPWFGMSRTQSLFVFVDPNTGVYVFEDRESFSNFVTDHWSRWRLREFPSGKILKYVTRSDEKDEKMRRFAKADERDDADPFEVL